MSKMKDKMYTKEAEYGFNLRTAREEAQRCVLCIDAPCSKGCPAGTDPGSFIRSIRFNNIKGAVETIRNNNVLGGSCARVCPYDRLCEKECSRCGIDKPIQIGRLQRFVIEEEKALQMKVLKSRGKKRGIKVACIGAGPASLACAAKLAIEGYQVTIYEEREKAGGVLTYGIASSRLPGDVVTHDIKMMEGLGINFKYGIKVGKDLDINNQEYDAIFIGAGLWGAVTPDISGLDKEGVWSAVKFLKKARTEKEAFMVGEDVIVIGGGNVAVDCGVTAKLLGAKNVNIIYRRTIEEAPADMAEFKHALSLGIGLTTNMAPVEILGDDRVEFIAFKGRDGVSEAKLKADMVIFAIGQKPENMKAIAPVEVNDKGEIMAVNGITSVAGIFAAGDAVNGGKTVVEAVAEGKEAAVNIIKYLLEKEGAE